MKKKGFILFLLQVILAAVGCKGGGEINASWDYAPPNAVQAGSVTTNSTVLNWDAVTIYGQAPIYLLYYRLDNSSAYQLLTNLSTTALTLSNLRSNQYYQFAVATCLTLDGPSSIKSPPAEIDTTPVPEPAFSLPGGKLQAATNISIVCSVTAAAVYYTTDGTTPTAAATRYTSPLTVTNNMTVKAIALMAGRPDSTVTSAVYTIAVQPPEFSPAAGSYSETQSVTVTTPTAGASIRYTLDGSDPTAVSGTLYSGPVSVSSNSTLKAIAYKSGLSDSTVSSAVYTIAVQPPEFSPAAGSYSETQSVTLTTPTAGASIRYTLDGSDPTAVSGTLYSGPVSVSSNCTLKAVAYKSGMENSTVTSAVYTIAVQPPEFSPAAGSYSETQSVTLTTPTAGASIRYTLDGSDPTAVSGTLYSGPVSVSSNCTLKAIAYKSGMENSTVTSAVYTIAVQPPEFSPAAGSYSETQSVTVTTPTAGASIRYTLDGSDPTAVSGTLYSGPVSVSSSCTLKAIAYKSGMENSTVTSAVYTITGPTQVSTPVFNGPPPGTYISAQSVTLSCPTPGASIYYTTDGSVPTTGDTLYTAPIPVSSDTTIKAFAVKAGLTDSAVTNGSFTFVAATTEDFNGWGDSSGYSTSWKTNTFTTSGLAFGYLNCMRYLNGGFYAIQLDDNPGGQFNWQVPAEVNGLQFKVQATTSMDDIAFYVKVNGTTVTNILFPATTIATTVDVTGIGASAPATIEVYMDTAVSTRRVLRFSEVSWY